VRLLRFPAPDKQRPVLVLTRPSAIDYLARVTVAPVTSTMRGVPSEVALGTEDVAKANLGRRVAYLGARRMQEVCTALAFAIGCDE